MYGCQSDLLVCKLITEVSTVTCGPIEPDSKSKIDIDYEMSTWIFCFVLLIFFKPISFSSMLMKLASLILRWRTLLLPCSYLQDMVRFYTWKINSIRLNSSCCNKLISLLERLKSWIKSAWSNCSGKRF